MSHRLQPCRRGHQRRATPPDARAPGRAPRRRGVPQADRHRGARRPRPGSLLYYLLDDIPPATLISGYVGLASGSTILPASLVPRRARRLTPHLPARGPMENICSGWRPAAPRFAPGVGQRPIGSTVEAPDLERPGDPLSWHRLDDLPPLSMRRRRRVDVVTRATGQHRCHVPRQLPDPRRPRGRRARVPYHVHRRRHRRRRRPRERAPRPRSRPSRGAALPRVPVGGRRRAARGERIADLRTAVLATSTRIECCTHLNDASARERRCPSSSTRRCPPVRRPPRSRRYTPEAERSAPRRAPRSARHLPGDWQGLACWTATRPTRFGWHWRDASRRGPARASWPVRYGGAGRTVLEQVVLAEELPGRRPTEAPTTASGSRCSGSTLLRWGTEEQKHRFLPRVLSGDDRWCQGFARARAGIRPRVAVDPGRTARATSGSWTARRCGPRSPHEANWVFVLTRTDPEAPQAHGICFLLVPASTSPASRSAGSRMITGEREFCEVFFTDARTAADHVVGEVHEGWAVANTLLGSSAARRRHHSRCGSGGARPADRTRAGARSRGRPDRPPATRRRQRRCEIMRLLGDARPGRPPEGRVRRPGGIDLEAVLERVPPARDRPRPRCPRCRCAGPQGAGPLVRTAPTILARPTPRRRGWGPSSTPAPARSTPAPHRCSATSSASRCSGSRAVNRGVRPTGAKATPSPQVWRRPRTAHVVPATCACATCVVHQHRGCRGMARRL